MSEALCHRPEGHKLVLDELPSDLRFREFLTCKAPNSKQERDNLVASFCRHLRGLHIPVLNIDWFVDISKSTMHMFTVCMAGSIRA